MEKMSFDSNTVLRLLGRPAPDDVGPWGPAGPVMYKVLTEVFRPGASEWLPALVTQANAAYIVNRITFAEDRKEAEVEIAAWIGEIIDDWCGTPPKPKWPPVPWPVPGPPDPRWTDLAAEKMTITYAHYVDAAVTYAWAGQQLGDSPVAQDVAAMAERFFEFGAALRLTEKM